MRLSWTGDFVINFALSANNCTKMYNQSIQSKFSQSGWHSMFMKLMNLWSSEELLVQNHWSAYFTENYTCYLLVVFAEFVYYLSSCFLFFFFFGFLFSTTNVCENTDQHRGVCQGSTGAVQMSSHRLPNTDHNMAERRTASRVRHASCYDWEWRVEHHRSQVLWRGQLRVRSTELCWRDCQQGGVELFWSRR